MKTQTSLYDFFAIVIPGFLWLLLISLWSNGHFIIVCNGINGLIGTTLLFIASYIVGLLYHKLVELLFRCFRNNPCVIKKQWEKFKKEYEKDGGTFEKQEKTGNRYKYYTAYYALMKNNMLNSIPVLEAQVAFLKNMVFLIPFYIITVCCCGISFSGFSLPPCCLASILLIVLIGSVYAFISIQNKIYYLVWEGHRYLLNLTQDDAASPTQQDVQDGTVSPANS